MCVLISTQIVFLRKRKDICKAMITKMNAHFIERENFHINQIIGCDTGCGDGLSILIDLFVAESSDPACRRVRGGGGGGGGGGSRLHVTPSQTKSGLT